MRNGLLMLCRTEEKLKYEMHEADRARKLGIPADVLDAQQIAAMEPEIRMQIAGGVLFTIMGLSTLRSDDRPDRAEESAPTGDPSIVPIGMPLIAGPGAISTVMVLVGQARDGGHRAALAVAIAANILLTLMILLAAPAIVARIGSTGQRIVSKIMGLITAVIGVQFILNGVETVALAILKDARS
jgi:multiple antibiotic resistance protein